MNKNRKNKATNLKKNGIISGRNKNIIISRVINRSIPII